MAPRRQRHLNSAGASVTNTKGKTKPIQTSSPLVIKLRREVHVLLSPSNDSHEKGGSKERKGHPRFPFLFQLVATQLKRTRQSRSFFLHSLTTSLSFAVAARPRCFLAVTASLLAAATQLPGLTHFQAQHIQGNVAARGHPRKFPIFQEEREIFFHLTGLAPQHSEQDFPRCVRTAQMKKCPRFLSMTQRRRPSQGF